MQWRKESHLTSNWSDRLSYQKLKTLKYKWLCPKLEPENLARTHRA